jgi:hypothetical protein
MGYELGSADPDNEQLGERDDRVAQAVKLLRKIVRTHAEFNDELRGEAMQLPEVDWPADESGAQLWGHLYDQKGSGIPKALARHLPSVRKRFVGTAVLCYAVCGESIPVMTIVVSPPNVYGFDSEPLGVEQLDGAIHDLETYDDALDAKMFGL